MDTLIPAGIFAAAMQLGSRTLDASRSATRTTNSCGDALGPQRSVVYPYGNAAYRDALTALTRISNYQDNWDSYGGRAISERAVQVGKQLLGIFSQDLPEVDVVPASSGGIQFEWQSDFAEVEILIAPDGVITISRTSPDGETVEVVASIGQPAQPLAPTIRFV